MSIKSGQRVIAQSLQDRTKWEPGNVISVNGANIWIMLDGGKQVLRWEHEVKPFSDSSDKHLTASS